MAFQLWLLYARKPSGEVWLCKRPASGIWAGLYCLPSFDSREALAGAVGARARERLTDEAAFTHVLTHRDLHIHPVRLQLKSASPGVLPGAWHKPGALRDIGLPAPVRKLLEA